MTRVVLLGPTGPNSPEGHPLLTALPGSPTVIGRLHGQLASLDPNPITIVRAEIADQYEGYSGTVVRTEDLAADLRAIADAVEDATENLLIMPANSVIHDELIYQITKSKR